MKNIVGQALDEIDMNAEKLADELAALEVFFRTRGMRPGAALVICIAMVGRLNGHAIADGSVSVRDSMDGTSQLLRVFTESAAKLLSRARAGGAL